MVDGRFGLEFLFFSISGLPKPYLPISLDFPRKTQDDIVNKHEILNRSSSADPPVRSPPDLCLLSFHREFKKTEPAFSVLGGNARR